MADTCICAATCRHYSGVNLWQIHVYVHVGCTSKDYNYL